MIELTEDEVRNSAGGILGFTIIGPNGEMINVDTEQIHSGVGQLTTFIQLGKKLKISEFNGFRDKPDGWYFPTNFGKTKSAHLHYRRCGCRVGGNVPR